MAATVVDLVTPHLLRIVQLASEAEKGVNVDWHLRDAVGKSMAEMRDQWNAQALVAAYIDGLEGEARRADGKRAAYVRVLQAAAASARGGGIA